MPLPAPFWRMKHLMAAMRGGAGGTDGAKRRALLLFTVAVLGILMWFDRAPAPHSPSLARNTNTAREAGSRPGRPGADLEAQLTLLRRIDHQRLAIEQRYRQIAPVYAETMGALLGFAVKPEEADIQKALQRFLPPGVNIDHLIAGTPTGETAGTRTVPISVQLTGRDSQAMLEAALQLGDPAAGTVWQDLALVADADKKELRLDGTLLLLTLEPAE